MIFKKILFLVFTILIVSCSSKKPVVRTVSKPNTNRTSTKKQPVKEVVKPKTETTVVQSKEANTSEELEPDFHFNICLSKPIL